MAAKQGNQQGLQINGPLNRQVFSHSLMNADGVPVGVPNNRLNTAGYDGGVRLMPTYYGDTGVPFADAGMTRLPAMQQQIMAGRGGNRPGDPDLGLPPPVAEQLGALSGLGSMPLGHGKQSMFQMGTNTSKVGFNRNQPRPQPS